MLAFVGMVTVKSVRAGPNGSGLTVFFSSSLCVSRTMLEKTQKYCRTGFDSNGLTIEKIVTNLSLASLRWIHTTAIQPADSQSAISLD